MGLTVVDGVYCILVGGLYLVPFRKMDSIINGQSERCVGIGVGVHVSICEVYVSRVTSDGFIERALIHGSSCIWRILRTLSNAHSNGL